MPELAPRHAAVVAWLERHVGEQEQPPHSNTGPFVRLCQASTWLKGSRWPWCVATWVEAWTVAGLKLPYKGAGAYTTLDWYRKHAPGWVVPITKAEPGAAVILNIGAGHLATLHKRYVGGGTVQTIDGNWGDKVSATTHAVTLIRGVVDPPEHAPPMPPAKPPLWDVVTSASGHSKLVFVGRQAGVAKHLGKLLNRYGGVTVRRHRKRK